MPGHPFFEASSRGHIRFDGRDLVGRNSGGYRVVTVGGKPRLIHRLVALAFHGPAPGREVNHKNGLKADNRASNLEWVTHAGNLQHARDLGLSPIPRDRFLRGLTDTEFASHRTAVEREAMRRSVASESETTGGAA